MAIINSKIPHILVVPFPAQGHVKPLMKLSRQIAKHGIKVTFVNIESVHEKIVSAAKRSDEVDEDEDEEHNIAMTSIPEGISSEDDKSDTFKLLESLRSTMPGFLTDLIERINSTNGDEKISCVIADVTIGWILETAEKMGAEPVVFMPSSAAAFAMALHIPKLLEEGSLDENGTITKDETISLSENIPSWTKNELCWSFSNDLKTQKLFFDCSLRVQKAAYQTKLLLCNTSQELEPSACNLIPNSLPIGPLLNLKTPKSSFISCNFHPEDESCISWLNNKPSKSVIYVSFGSLAIFSQQQLDELALGLELSGHAFLWVVRSDLANGSQFGKIVEWAPQVKVLSHVSVGCFLSHCGWNSTLEGLSNGVPFLCWPYFADQYHNQNYVCDKWGTGLRIDSDENGIRTRYEIKKKIDMLSCDDVLKGNALKMKEICDKSVGEGGSSYRNFEMFIDHLRK
ncbi:UDP-glucuronosyl and UDP-glucosyl transferase [Handroanthus impetiginosus]|uniref:UDP-glucuronosyl and UDP-glucosyl transferase n=1 Tax=Handroanthus impetiginosus TaxID=429701 RepID=A0A2G9GV01_9LAMI|nr:UDP-glucuronosyl and UDP-glucosyl transferase [Handroanthus impetiginosus]